MEADCSSATVLKQKFFKHIIVHNAYTSAIEKYRMRIVKKQLHHVLKHHSYAH